MIFCVLECLPGYYRPDALAMCMPCPVGTYSNMTEIPGQYHCISCPNGTTTNNTGGTSVYSCNG